MHRSIPPDLDDLAGRFPARPVPRTLALLVAAVLAAGVGWWLLRPAGRPVEATIPLASGAATASSVATSGGAAAPVDGPAPSGGATAEGAEATTTTLPDLVVQAAGAVQEPGVRRLPAGARVDDLIRASGGFARDADRDRVNLAASLRDGERVWIPRRGDRELPDVVAGTGGGTAPDAGGADGSSSSGGSSGSTPAGPVDLNAASEAELDALPGIGPATAAAILAHRSEVGRFSSVDELLDVRGIGEAKLEQLRPLVKV